MASLIYATCRKDGIYDLVASAKGGVVRILRVRADAYVKPILWELERLADWGRLGTAWNTQIRADSPLGAENDAYLIAKTQGRSQKLLQCRHG